MRSFLSRLFPSTEQQKPLAPGIFHWKTPDEAPIQYRLHLRIEDEGMGVLIVNAATVLHLNTTATEHAMQLVRGLSEEEAAEAIAARYRVSKQNALNDHRDFREQVFTLATNPDVDPVVYLDLDRAEPLDDTPSAPYRIDLALTYRSDASGAVDPLARRRVDRELSTEEWQRILDKIWRAGVPHVTFTGGEPTLREDLGRLIAYAEELGQVTGLLTNGRRLSDASYLDTLAQAGLDHILVTFIPADFDCERGLRNALASDVFTAAHLTLARDNEEETVASLEHLHDLGIRSVSLSAEDRSKALAETLVRAREYAADIGLDLIWDLPAPYSTTNPLALELETPPIGAGRAWLYVEPDGDVLPSQGIDEILGNLHSDPWEEIWSVYK
ncbi:MAG: radical SAM protein [Anaerolineales bacterium]|nr:radical SAM protein [Anaerolineales bacterium]